jgi:hypothetical protein
MRCTMTCLRGDAAEVFRRHFLVEVIARLVLGARLFARDFQLRIGHLVDHGAAMVDFILARIAIDGNDRVRFAAEIPFVRRDQGRLERFEQHVERNRAFALKQTQRLAQGRFVGCGFGGFRLSGFYGHLFSLALRA